MRYFKITQACVSCRINSLAKWFMLLCMLLGVSKIQAQIKALTGDGKEVLLMNNGTWKYVTDTAGGINSDSIPFNKQVFSKDKEARFLVKSKVAGVGVYINPKKVTFKNATEDESGPEYHFNFKDKDGYGMVITEKTVIDIVNMPAIVLANAQKVAPDAYIVHKEFRMVNNIKVLCLQLNGTTQSIKFTYYGYYYSDKTGTVQLVTFVTNQDLFETVKPEFENFLNGFVTVEQ